MQLRSTQRTDVGRARVSFRRPSTAGFGLRSATIDKLGRRTQYEYDTRGNPARTVYPDSTESSATYDAEGRRVTSTDRGGRTTTYTYDALRRLIRTTFPDGSLRTMISPIGSA